MASNNYTVYSKIKVVKYYKPEDSLIISSNISFDNTDEITHKPYFTHNYDNLNTSKSNNQSSSLKDNLTSTFVLSYKKSDNQILDQYLCKNIEINQDLIHSTHFMEKFKDLINKEDIKYCLVKNHKNTKNMWISKTFKQEYNKFNTSTNVGYHLKLLGLKETLEPIYINVIELMCKCLPSVYCFDFIELKSLIHIPFLYGFKKADYLHFIETYGINILHPDLYFYHKLDKYKLLLVAKKSNHTNLLIVKSLLNKLLLKLETKKLYLKNFNNIFNDYLLSNHKIEFMLTNFSILHYLKNLMFDHSIGIEIVKNKYNKYCFTVFSNNEQNLLSFIKLLHFKIYDKILQFTIDFENRENFDKCIDDFVNDPSLTVLADEENLQISLIGDRWDDLFKSYMKLNQKNIKYNFFIDLSNEFKEFIIGKKFGKINKIEKTLNNTCSISLLLPSFEGEEKEFQDTEFITIKIESDNFIESINCLKLVQQELPYERQLYIPESFHKYIIGMNGENIQSITRRYNCFIQFMNTFESKQNEFSFIRYPNVIIRCPLKTADNVEKVIKEIQSLSMEIFNLKKITSLNDQNDMELQGIKILKLKRQELDLILNADLSEDRRLHKKIGELEMKYNLFIRFPEYDDYVDEEDEELLLIFKSCKHNTVLKLQDIDKKMSILKLTDNDDKKQQDEFTEDENLQLCIDEIIKDYFPKKDKRSKYNMKNIQGLDKDQLTKLQRMMIWKYNSMVQKDKDGGYSVYTI